MIKEKLIIKKEAASINISGGVVDSIRFTDKLQQGFRVYDNNFIGVSGAEGKVNEDEMWNKAINNLKNKVNYNVDISTNHQEKISMVKNKMSHKQFLKNIKQLIERLNKLFPNFIFSNKVFYQNDSYQLVNDKNLDLQYEDEYFTIVLLIKDKKTANLFDAFYLAEERYYDEEKIVYDIGLLLNNFHNIIDIENNEYPIIINFQHLRDKFLTELRGDLVSTKTSLFSDKIGKKVFNDNFTLYLDKNPNTTIEVPFFDYEGVINDNYRYKIIDSGVIVSPYTTKMEAKMYNFRLTGSAKGSFDSVPTLEESQVFINESTSSIDELTKGKAIYVVAAEGGDYTSSGDYGSPVQLAYLIENNKIIGRLPNINISGNIFKMFNENYLGKAKNSIFKYMSEKPVILKMKVSKL